MDSQIFGIFLFTTLLGINSALPYSLITQPQHLQLKEDEDALFRCELEGDFTGAVTWMNDSKLISFGRNLAYPHPRMAIVGEGMAYNLEIKDVTLMDEGEWECQIPGPRTLRQVNTLTVVIEPSITATPENGELEVMEGETVKLFCEADGKPEPVVTWTKERSDLFNETGMELSFGSISRDNSGEYTCTATNGVGSGEMETFNINVVYPPTVEVEEDLVHTGPNDEVQLTCIFMSNPQVNVIWQHNEQDINLEEGGNFQAAMSGSDGGEITSTLTILQLKAEDLGTYTCIGGNGKGQPASGNIELSGLPYEVEFLSDTDSDYSDTYTLEWEFFSVADPTECQLEVTEYPDGTPFGSNVVPSEVGANSRHRQAYRITGLTVNTEYGAKVNCKNEFGESGFTEEFHFKTSEVENPAPVPTTTVEPETEKETVPPVKPTTQPVQVETTEDIEETSTKVVDTEEVATPSPTAEETSEIPVGEVDIDDIDDDDDDDDKDDSDEDVDDNDEETKDDESDEKDDGGPSEKEDVVGSAPSTRPWSLVTWTSVAVLMTLLYLHQ